MENFGPLLDYKNDGSGGKQKSPHRWGNSGKVLGGPHFTTAGRRQLAAGSKPCQRFERLERF